MGHMSRRIEWMSAWLSGLAAAALLAGCQPVIAPRLSPTRAYVDARHALLAAAEDPDPRVRTHALEALAVTEGQAAGAVLLQSLRDDRTPVISAAAMAVGQCRYAPATPKLLELIEAPNMPPKLRCSLIYALHRLGNDKFTGELAQMLRHQDRFVRAEAARVMGKMGEPSAVGPLKSLQRNDREVVVRLNVAEALAVLGDDRSIGLLEAFTKSQFLEDRLIAVAAMGKLRHARAIYVLNALVADAKQDSMVRVAAAGSLAQLGEAAGRELVLEAIKDPEGVLRQARGETAVVRTTEVSGLQTLAVMSLEHMGGEDAVATIYPLLESKRGPVRVAAARAMLRLLKRYRPAAPDVTAPPKESAAAPKVTQPPPQQELHSAGAKD